MATTPARLPLPRTLDPMAAPSIGWAILGPGSIADRFATSLTRHTTQRIVAVGSRTAANSAAFALRHSIPNSYSSYEQTVQDSAVDIVYISTPNSLHYMHTMLALAAGKHVLVEKSFAANRVQAREMVEEAERRGLFLMEAMWPRFLPFMDTVRQVIENGTIGTPIGLTADLGGYDEFDAESRMYSPALGGGITLDRGIYVAALSSFLLGRAETVSVTGIQAATGVDAHLAMTLGTGHGAVAQLLATMLVKTPSNAYFTGSAGSIEFASPWYLSPKLSLLDSSGVLLDESTSPLASDLDGLCYEAAEAARMIATGATFSPLMPARESLEISETLDLVLKKAHESWAE